MPHRIVTQGVLLPELELERSYRRKLHIHMWARKKRLPEVCPRCATLAEATYDHRRVRIKDAPLRNRAVTLLVTKRRLYCKPCKKPFTEPVPGVRKGRRDLPLRNRTES